jgi:RNA polymerase sigma-70 factor, ECF subfamily
MIDGEDKIVLGAIAGDASAFGVLYDRYQPAIYRFVALKVGRREDAEDITHQVFMRAWQSVGTYEGRGFPFSSWLYRIARNQIVDFYRAHREHTDLDEVEPLLLKEDDTADALDLKADVARVRAAMLELRTDYQDVIILRFIEERTLEEAAQALDRSVGATKVLQHRALRSLRALLDGSEPSNTA